MARGDTDNLVTKSTYSRQKKETSGYAAGALRPREGAYALCMSQRTVVIDRCGTFKSGTRLSGAEANPETYTSNVNLQNSVCKHTGETSILVGSSCGVYRHVAVSEVCCRLRVWGLRISPLELLVLPPPRRAARILRGQHEV